MPIGTLLLTTLVYAIAVGVHLPSLLRSGDRRGLAAFFILTALALLLSYATILYPQKVPTINDPADRIFTDIGQKIFR